MERIIIARPDNATCLLASLSQASLCSCCISDEICVYNHADKSGDRKMPNSSGGDQKQDWIKYFFLSSFQNSFHIRQLREVPLFSSTFTYSARSSTARLPPSQFILDEEAHQSSSETSRLLLFFCIENQRPSNLGEDQNVAERTAWKAQCN